MIPFWREIPDNPLGIWRALFASRSPSLKGGEAAACRLKICDTADWKSALRTEALPQVRQPRCLLSSRLL